MTIYIYELVSRSRSVESHLGMQCNARWRWVMRRSRSALLHVSRPTAVGVLPAYMTCANCLVRPPAAPPVISICHCRAPGAPPPLFQHYYCRCHSATRRVVVVSSLRGRCCMPVHEQIPGRPLPRALPCTASSRLIGI